jgi:DNA-binding XRE family transcriptional regulator
MSAMVHILRAYRQKTGVTLEQLGRTIGASKGFLSKVEKGQQTPSLKLAVKISEATNGEVAPGDLVAPASGAGGDAS